MFQGLVDRSLKQGIYSFISIKSHNNEYFFSRIPLMHMLDYANEHHIPVWTAEKLLDFLQMKDEASFKNINWKIISSVLRSYPGYRVRTD